jgi:hypothetical protein
MTAEQILTAIGLVGIGGLLKSFLDFIIESRKSKQVAQNTLKEARYKSIILMCFAFVNYEKEKTNLIINRPDITSLDRLKNELHAEFINMALYGSDDVIQKFKLFISIQNEKVLNDLAIAMRKDLFGIKTKLKSETFEIDL